MALFPESPNDAVLSAIAMQKKVALYNESRQQRGEVPIKIGIGLHTGSLMLGTIGGTQRMKGTVIADAVNLASRLEGLTKQYGTAIAISEKVLFQLENMEQYGYRFLDRVKVKGKKEAVAVFEIYDSDSVSQQQLKNSPEAILRKQLYCIISKNLTLPSNLFRLFCRSIRKMWRRSCTSIGAKNIKKMACPKVGKSQKSTAKNKNLKSLRPMRGCKDFKFLFCFEGLITLKISSSSQ
ncbi:adenylate/guanylate cyclase domain-containing protein [Pseudanabaena sp. UWO311]